MTVPAVPAAMRSAALRSGHCVVWRPLTLHTVQFKCIAYDSCTHLVLVLRTINLVLQIANGLHNIAHLGGVWKHKLRREARHKTRQGQSKCNQGNINAKRCVLDADASTDAHKQPRSDAPDNHLICNLQQQSADSAAVIRFGRKDAGRSFKDGWVLDEWSSPPAAPVSIHLHCSGF